MHNHFDNFLNLKALILERRPKLIVECGAGSGELTRQLASLLDVYEFKLYVVSDQPLEEIDSRVNFVSGLSYELLESFHDDTVDLCIVDTDHNYWTLMKELSVLSRKVREGGLVAMHDVSTFYHDTGMAMSYWDGKPYPKDEIEKCAPYGSLGDALIEFLHVQKMNFKMLAWNPCSNGAAVIEKRHQDMFAIVIPGPKAIFAKKETVHASV